MNSPVYVPAGTIITTGGLHRAVIHARGAKFLGSRAYWRGVDAWKEAHEMRGAAIAKLEVMGYTVAS